jgi:peptidoglycan/xylan/chitin deacetylase (PgdA/CDA1 family)
MGGAKLLKGLDNALSQAYLRVLGERNALLCFLFHSLFEDEKEIDSGDVAPIQRMTIQGFRGFVDYYLSHGYAFVSHREVLAGLDPARKYALITFDDGYYNNRRALPVLREFDVPALFFISAGHVAENRSFWWDAFHREYRRRGWDDDRIDAEAGKLKDWTHDRLQAHLMAQFGEDCLRPRGDLDRPFTPAELADFAREPRVHIGNHTRDHAILPNYPREGMRSQISGAQEMLRQMIGETPEAIAYPNGNFNFEAMEVARECGLKIGFSCERRKVFPSAPDESGWKRMHLGRFTLNGGPNVAFQLANFRSDISPYGWLKSRASGHY